VGTLTESSRTHYITANTGPQFHSFRLFLACAVKRNTIQNTLTRQDWNRIARPKPNSYAVGSIRTLDASDYWDLTHVTSELQTTLTMNLESLVQLWTTRGMHQNSSERKRNHGWGRSVPSTSTGVLNLCKVSALVDLRNISEFSQWDRNLVTQSREAVESKLISSFIWFLLPSLAV
jgi:hypothetical protein